MGGRGSVRCGEADSGIASSPAATLVVWKANSQPLGAVPADALHGPAAAPGHGHTDKDGMIVPGAGSVPVAAAAARETHDEMDIDRASEQTGGLFATAWCFPRPSLCSSKRQHVTYNVIVTKWFISVMRPQLNGR